MKPNTERTHESKFRAGIWGVLILILAMVGCASTPDIPEHITMTPRFVLESEGGVPLRLPVSNVVIQVNPKAIISEYDLLGVEVRDHELGKCLVFSMSAAATREWYRLSVQNQGKRLVMLLNGNPYGVSRIERPEANGYIVLFVEMLDDQLEELAENIKGTLLEARVKLDNA